MIDTVRVKTSAPWRVEKPPPGWSRRDGTRLQPDATSTEFVMFQHEGLGLRVSGTKLGVVNIEASLPRVLHGSNGSLLKTSREIAEAFGALEECAGLVAELATATTQLTRLDACWNVSVPGGVRTVIQAVGNKRHRNVRRATVVYQGESINYPGKDHRIRIYDKGREVTGKPSDVVRLEVQLRKDRVVPFNTCAAAELGPLAYQTLRESLKDFDPVRVPKPGTVVEFLAYLQEEAITDGQGNSVLDVYLYGLGDDRRRKLLAQLKKVTGSVRGVMVNFDELLPADHLPEPVEVAA